MDKQKNDILQGDKVMRLENANKSYKSKNKNINVLSNINSDFSSGYFYAIMGHSGSGKSTLINILGLVDTLDSGIYELYKTNVSDFNDVQLSNLRMKNIGFIFQGFHLSPTLKAYENVIVPMLINKEINSKERKQKAFDLLKSIGLEARVDHYPKELSGGEQQRVAIARALANNPNIILADEPTGNLDEKSAKDIFALLKDLSKKGKCVIVVSHSNEVKNYADKVYKIIDGKLVGDGK
ncbi:MAG: ABC transporter ATP-binding protein [Oscillospiraceae bacterium]|nr:ABC transporter ATP-binding protein [Oscillospiraceae bacterium]